MLKKKVVILGDSSVGKSSILYRLKKDDFQVKSDSTIGCEFFAHDVKLPNSEIKLLLWDTAGQEVFRSFTKNFLRGATAVIITFDVTNQRTYDSIVSWIEEVKASLIKPIIVVVGNKLDLGNMIHERDTLKEELHKYDFNIYYFPDVSAKSGHNVTELFEFLGQKLLDNYPDILNLSESDNTTINIRNDTKKQQGCCS